MLETAGDVSAAAAALAGLVLVFFGSSIASLDSYSTEQRGSVQGFYRRRAWPAFIALVAAVNAGEKMHQRAGVKMHHGGRLNA
jgi:hypothetical protein